MTLFSGHALACRRGERLVFRGLDFALDAGAALVLTGANGRGKGGLVRLMENLLPPQSGTLSWEGQAIGRDPAAHRARLHFIGHQDALKPVLTVFETVAFWGGLRGGNNETATASLARFGLGHLADSPCRLLSAGQPQSLALARPPSRTGPPRRPRD